MNVYNLIGLAIIIFLMSVLFAGVAWSTNWRFTLLIFGIGISVTLLIRLATYLLQL